MRTKNKTEETNNNQGKTFLLRCDIKSKEERLKCDENYKNEKINMR